MVLHEHHAALIARFPRLFKSVEPEAGIAVDTGWNPILVDLFQEIDALLSDAQAAMFRVIQIKEKFGGLRVYYAFDNSAGLVLDLISSVGAETTRVLPRAHGEFPREAVDRCIAKAAERALATCEYCGNPGRLRPGRWTLVLCDACAAARAAERGSDDEQWREWTGFNMTESKFTRILFLDFDGVLHPAGGAPGQALPFCWVDILAEELASHPDVGIVVHSSWIEQYTVEDLREFLGPLGSRLVGTVEAGEQSLTVLSFARSRPDLRHWLVIDDDMNRFDSGFPGSVLFCDPSTGISNTETRRQLRDWLTACAPGAAIEKEQTMTELADEKDGQPVLWTAWLDYNATREGRTIMSCIAYARDAEEIRRHFADKFGRWSDMGCQAARGVTRNECIELLWSDAALRYIENAGERRGRVDAHSSIHVNFS